MVALHSIISSSGAPLDRLLEFVVGLLTLGFWIFVWISPWCAMLVAAFIVLGLPLRRQQRAHVFLDAIELSLSNGHRPEDAIAELSSCRDKSLGFKFHLLAAQIEDGVPLTVALTKVPTYLPPQVTKMLRVGAELGNVQRVIPACRGTLASGSSRSLGGLNYLLVFPPLIPFALISSFLAVVIFPKFREIFRDILGSHPLPATTQFVTESLATPMTFWFVGAGTVLLFVALLLGNLVRAPKPLQPLLDALYFRLPWRRKRMQRDFSAMLAILLDAGMPEERALTLAAESTANLVFIRRAQEAVRQLQQGVKLTEAVQILDDSGEFKWRLTNAVHAHGGFMAALTGWRDALEAKAYQQEQAVSQVVTTGLVILNGVLVCLVAMSVFQPLTTIVQELALW